MVAVHYIPFWNGTFLEVPCLFLDIPAAGVSRTPSKLIQSNQNLQVLTKRHDWSVNPRSNHRCDQSPKPSNWTKGWSWAWMMDSGINDCFHGEEEGSFIPKKTSNMKVEHMEHGPEWMNPIPKALLYLGGGVGGVSLNIVKHDHPRTTLGTFSCNASIATWSMLMGHTSVWDRSWMALVGPWWLWIQFP